MSEVTNEDCMVLMARYPDKYFDLAIVDPPYGIGMSSNPVRQKHNKKNWDDFIPNDRYFQELFRVSTNQIIWGGNYFDLKPTQGFVIWDKKQPHEFSLAMCEFAWMSFQKPAKIFEFSIHKHNQSDKIHPTQKPVNLYKWLLKNYATCDECGGSGEVPSLRMNCDVQTCGKCKGNDVKILDTHLGSGSSRIAAYDMGFDFTACELDKDYFEAQEKRFKNHIAQLSLFNQSA